MSEQQPGHELVLAHSGQLVDLSDFPQVASALSEVKRIKGMLADAERTLRDVVVEQAEIQGTKTLYVDGVGKLEVRGDKEVWYDAEEIEIDLRAIDCPESVIREIVLETTTYKVDARRAAMAAKANPAYAEIIERHKHVQQKTPQVQIT